MAEEPGPPVDGMRARFLAAPEARAPEPWGDRVVVAVGGLVGVGFGTDPDSGRDLLLVASGTGLGLLGATGERLARDYDQERGHPDGDLTCPGIGPLAGTRVRMAGLYGGGLHTVSADGWGVEVVGPDWPHHRVLLSAPGHSPWAGDHGVTWWHIFHSRYMPLRAAGFSPSGRTLAVAVGSDVTLWSRS
jgi:hypothetical protein